METTITKIKGLAFDVFVTETTHKDARGIFFYRCVVIVREHKTGVERVACRSRIPGTGKTLARDVQQRGVRALDALAA